MTNNKENPIKYCLYARKSSESDERQALSIDSQIKEMKELAEKEELNVVEVKQESHSAKDSGTRPVFLQMLHELREKKYNGILTWAPDRLSRNAGDLGSLVDLMDRGNLQHIKTNSQSFSNNPNEKFLLMILCSQAKLENDNRGLNVKRGIRSKCEMGWRPAPAPIGYLNYSHKGVKKLMLDKRATPYLKKMFEFVGNEGYSGRDVKDWLDKDNQLKEHVEMEIPLSMIYRILKNTFYYGEFEYPKGSGNWYEGAHEPIISKALFDKVQEKLDNKARNKGKTKWGSKKFDFKYVFKCAYCGASVVAEEKFKKLKSGKTKKYIYYHCSKQVDPNCPEPYVNKKDLVKEFISFVKMMERKNSSILQITTEVQDRMKKYESFKNQILKSQNITIKEKLKFSQYFKHVLKNENTQDILVVLKCFKSPLYFHNGSIYSSMLA